MIADFDHTNIVVNIWHLPIHMCTQENNIRNIQK